MVQNYFKGPVCLSAKSSWYLILSILLIALAVRVLALLSLSETPYFGSLLTDEQFYHTWATQIADGRYNSFSVYRAAPLPAYVMAIVYKVFSPDVLYVRILNILLGVATCFVVYLIAIELGNRPLGLIAAAMAAFYNPFIFYSIVPLKTSLSVFLFAVSVYTGLAVIRAPSVLKKLLLGIAIGLTMITRENALVLFPVMAIMILWSEYRDRASLGQLVRSFVIVLAGLMIVLAPFAIRNYRVSGEWVLTTHQAGIGLYLGNNLENPDPYYRPVAFASPTPYHQEPQFRIEASKRTGHELSPTENSSYWIREVARTAMAHPAAFLWKLWQKVLVLFNQFDAGDHYNIDFMSRFATFFRLPFIAFAIILPLGLAGMAISAMASRALVCVSAIFWAYASTLVLFFTNTRYRLPLDVLLLVFAVIGLRNLFLAFVARKRKTIGVFMTVLILSSIVEYLPVRGTDDMTAYYNTHALILDAKGFEEEAIRYWEISSHMNKPYSAFANYALAKKYFGKNNPGRAISYLVKIPDNSFAASNKHDLLGDISLRQGDTAEAIAHYERSLSINSGSLAPRAKLVRIFERSDGQRALEESQRLEYIRSFYEE